MTASISPNACVWPGCPNSLTGGARYSPNIIRRAEGKPGDPLDSDPPGRALRSGSAPVDFATKAHKGPEYLRLSPDRTVPMLVVDGAPHTESARLALTLMESHPDGEAPLLRSEIFRMIASFYHAE